jgi:uncharacterized protein (DUF2235 family)
MKRLVLCCDGTWNKADSPDVTNIEKISRCVQTNSDPSRPEQMVQYLRGVGTSYRIDRLFGGWLGLGLEASILDAYRWLMLNYTEGDEIFIFGFSRGAYAARSLVGMIHNVGLLKKEGFEPRFLQQARDLYAKDRDAKEFRLDHCYSDGPKIQFLGVFDTVGALGLPPPLGFVHRTFHNVELSDAVQHGRHALAIDERRRAFTPTLWQSAKDALLDDRTVRQVWFPGVHSDVGGGYARTGLSDITLKWMIEEAAAYGLAFDEAQVKMQLSGPTSKDLRPHNSMKLIYRLTGPIYRAVGGRRFRQGRRLLQIDELRNSKEWMYANVRVSKAALEEPPGASPNVTWLRNGFEQDSSWGRVVEPPDEPED